MTFFLFQLIFQNTYLEKLYNYNKVSNVSKNISDMIYYMENNWILNRNCNYYSLNFKYQNNTPLLIVNKDKQILNDNFFDEFNIIVIKADDGKRMHLIMDFLAGMDKDIIDDFRQGRRISVEGVAIGNTDYILPVKVNYNDFEYANENLIYPYLKSGKPSSIINFNGYINKLNIVREYNELNYMSGLLLDEVTKIISSDANFYEYGNKTNKIVAGERWNNIDYILFTKSQVIEGNSFFFFAIDKVEKIAPIFKSLNIYYIAMYLICFVILIIMSFYFSKRITKPILDLNEVAKKIADLDFSVRAEMNTNDELEELSCSINSISKNLERTINNLKLTNIQLAEEAANREENEKRIRYLLTNLSHEFKTPLGIISGFVDVIRDNVYEKEPEYYFDVISDEIENLNYLIHETIELSKLESGFYNIVFSNFNIKDLLEEVCSAFENKLEENKLTLIKNIFNFTVNADFKKVEQVLINFVSNAVKYTKEEGSIYIRTEDYDKEKIIIFVENEGEIPQEDIDNIWNRYYRTEKSGNPFQGSGLGLEIVRNILELHKSIYGVKNANGRVQFFFTLNKGKKVNYKSYIC